MIYLTLFLEFFKIGLFCFGGAFGMIPLIEETVTKYAWLSEGEFYAFLGVCESTPGPIAVNMATYIGSSQGGVLGSIAATLGVVTPSFIIILLVASLLKGLTDNKHFRGFLSGVKPVIIALILSAGAVLAAKSAGYSYPLVFSPNFAAITIFALLAVLCIGSRLIFKKKIPSIALILISAVLGIGVSVIFELV
jgi:chromate transporter